MSIAALAGSIVGSLIDPIALVGYVAAGALMRNYWGALAAGVGWRLFWHVLLTVPANRMDQSSPSEYMLVGAVIGAALATSAVFLIARSRRTSAATVETSEQAPDDPPAP